MKKSLFFFAAAALALTACTSEDEVVQNAAKQPANAVSFDVYMPQTTNVTRAGDPAGVMTTEKLKTADKGFGVFAFYQDNANYASTLAPNFMFNEHIHWASGWTYSPLKYWPNETTEDSQDPAATAPACDKLSFFAYAPYVNLTTEGTMTTERPSTTTNAYVEATPSTGILAITRENVTGDPLVEWKYSTDLDNNVDLLWGVAPAGLSYTAVNGTTSSAEFGMPILNMVKPDKDQKIKFLFQHALSRIGLSVVSAIDQIAAGDDGGVFNKEQTRVLIKSVNIYGDFGKQGVLNLNNGTANTANWIVESIDKSEVGGDALFTIDESNHTLAKALRYEAAQISAVASDANDFAAINTGVLPSEQPLLASVADLNKVASDLTYAFGKALYKEDGSDYVRATTSATEAVDAYTKDGDNYTQAFATSTGSKVSMDGSTKYYKLTVDATLSADADHHCVLDQVYYTKSGAAGSWVYTKHVGTGAETEGTYYTLSETELSGDDYTGTCYTALIPRYFMVIPTGDTPIKVKITYAVVTKDEKLTGNVSNIENEITKETSLTLQSGKSYNLKLILGLTSVKLDASVADWQVADDAEVYLPQNTAE